MTTSDTQPAAAEPGRMTLQDVLWLHMDRPTNLMVVDSVSWFDEPVDWELVREQFLTRMVERFPVFRRRAVVSSGTRASAHWEDYDFDIDDHLVRATLPAPGDASALQAYASRLRSVPLDRGKALWQAHLVDGYGSGSAMVLRMHHAVADGIRLMQVVLGLMDDEEGHPLRPPPAVGRTTERPPTRDAPGLRLPGPLTPLSPVASGTLDAASRAGALARGSVSLATHPQLLGGLVGRVARTLRADEATLPRLAYGRSTRTVWTGEPGFDKSLRWAAPLPFDGVRALGQASGSTVNDVLLTLLAMSMHRWLAARGATPETVDFMVPVNLRPLDEALPADLGNYFALVYLRLPVGAMSPAERLQMVRTRTGLLKSSHEALVTFGLQRATSLAPHEIYVRIVSYFADSAVGVITNVPGPRQPMYLAGHRVAGTVGFAPCNGRQALTATIFSYAGTVTVGVAADNGLVPGAEEISDGVWDAFFELGQALGVETDGRAASS